MTLRDLTSDDTPALLAFYQLHPPQIRRLFDPFAAYDAETIGRHLRESEEARHLSIGLVDADGTMVGHSFVLDLHGEEPVFGIGLSHNILNRGWGYRLMREVLTRTDAAGVHRIALTVIKDNTRAKDLYEKLGFHVTGEATHRAPDDSFKMERRT